MKFLSEIIIRKHNFSEHSLDFGQYELIEHLVNQTRRIHKDLSEELIREQIKSNIVFTIFDTNKPNPFTDQTDIFRFDNFNKDGNCAVLAEYELII